MEDIMIESYSSQKVSNELNVAMEIPEEERIKSEEINIGYNNISNQWELIVKYNGDIKEAANRVNADVTTLLGGYAIIRIREERIMEFADMTEVEYIEKPHRLFFS